jgi:hypothetical protein
MKMEMSITKFLETTGGEKFTITEAQRKMYKHMEQCSGRKVVVFKGRCPGFSTMIKKEWEKLNRFDKIIR